MNTNAFSKDLSIEYNYAKPFPHIVVDNFLSEEDMLALMEALQQETFSEKESDLFHFLQTNDLNASEQEAFKSFIEMLKNKKEWFEGLAGKDLAGDIDLQGSIYADTHYLLCHDDQLEDRKLAFIYYFTSLKKEEGGALRLYHNIQGKPVPEKFVEYQPKENTLVIFTVSPKSFHEVREVVGDVERVSLGGWFH